MLKANCQNEAIKKLILYIRLKIKDWRLKELDFIGIEIY